MNRSHTGTCCHNNRTMDELEPYAAKAGCRDSTLDNVDDSSKLTFTIMMSRSRTGIRCHSNRVVEEPNDEK